MSADDETERGLDALVESGLLSAAKAKRVKSALGLVDVARGKRMRFALGVAGVPLVPAMIAAIHWAPAREGACGVGPSAVEFALFIAALLVGIASLALIMSGVEL